MLVKVEAVEDSEIGVEALARIASARDIALKQSNRFLLGGMLSSLFYIVKVVGLRVDIVFFDVRIFETPYGLFVFGIIGAVCLIVAQLRFLDRSAFDVKLKKMSIQDGPMHARYEAFPSSHDWLLPSLEAFGHEQSPLLARVFFTALGLIVFAFYIVPLVAGAHFLINWPDMAGDRYTHFQWWVVLLLSLTAVLTLLFSQWIYHSKAR